MYIGTLTTVHMGIINTPTLQSNVTQGQFKVFLPVIPYKNCSSSLGTTFWEHLGCWVNKPALPHPEGEDVWVRMVPGTSAITYPFSRQKLNSSLYEFFVTTSFTRLLSLSRFKCTTRYTASTVPWPPAPY